MNSVKLISFLPGALVPRQLPAQYISDPYSQLMHYKRAFKALRALNESGGGALLLGRTHQKAFNWSRDLRHVDVGASLPGRATKAVLAAAPASYQLIICVDLPRFARELINYTLPVLGVATAAELHEYPEVLEVVDYLLPVSAYRADIALRRHMWKRIVNNQKDEIRPVKEATARRRS